MIQSPLLQAMTPKLLRAFLHRPLLCHPHPHLPLLNNSTTCLLHPITVIMAGGTATSNITTTSSNITPHQLSHTIITTLQCSNPTCITTWHPTIKTKISATLECPDIHQISHREVLNPDHRHPNNHQNNRQIKKKKRKSGLPQYTTTSAAHSKLATMKRIRTRWSTT